MNWKNILGLVIFILGCISFIGILIYLSSVVVVAKTLLTTGFIIGFISLTFYLMNAED